MCTVYFSAHTIVWLIAFKTINTCIACIDSCKRWTDSDLREQKRLCPITRCVPRVLKRTQTHRYLWKHRNVLNMNAKSVKKNTPSIFHNVISKMNSILKPLLHLFQPQSKCFFFSWHVFLFPFPEQPWQKVKRCLQLKSKLHGKLR